MCNKSILNKLVLPFPSFAGGVGTPEGGGQGPAQGQGFLSTTGTICPLTSLPSFEKGGGGSSFGQFVFAVSITFTSAAVPLGDMNEKSMFTNENTFWQAFCLTSELVTPAGFSAAKVCVDKLKNKIAAINNFFCIISSFLQVNKRIGEYVNKNVLQYLSVYLSTYLLVLILANSFSI